MSATEGKCLPWGQPAVSNGDSQPAVAFSRGSVRWSRAGPPGWPDKSATQVRLPAARNPIIERHGGLAAGKSSLFKSRQLERMADSGPKDHLHTWTRAGGLSVGQRKERNRTVGFEGSGGSPLGATQAIQMTS